MSTHYEVPTELWEPIKNEILHALREVARRRRTITYSELVSKVTKFSLQPESHSLHAMLDEVSTAEEAAGRGLISVVVVRKLRDQMPGQGFFTIAAELGRDVDDKVKFWSEELKLVHDANARRKNVP